MKELNNDGEAWWDTSLTLKPRDADEERWTMKKLF